MNTSSTKAMYTSLPSPVRRFIVRAVIFIGVWKLLYEVLLRPSELLDDQLTSFTGKATASLVSHIYQPATSTFDTILAHIFINDRLILQIADGCNALELLITYLGFIFCLHITAKRSWLFAINGVLVIFAANVLRCVALVWLHETHPGWVDFAHHYLFQLLMYMIIFALWVVYSKPMYAAQKK